MCSMRMCILEKSIFHDYKDWKYTDIKALILAEMAAWIGLYITVIVGEPLQSRIFNVCREVG